MSGISEELHTGEKIIKDFGIHPFEYLGAYIIGLILTMTVFLAVFGIPILVITECIRRAHKYYLTDQRVIHRFTFFSKRTSSVLYDKIQDIHLTQGILDRMVGLGKIHLNTAGTNVVEIIFRGVKGPVEVKRMIEQCMMEEKK